MNENTNPAPVQKLETHERPKYMHFARITWLGSFPTDMLRYDRCFPVNETHARMMETPCTEPQTIIVARFHDLARWSFTPERWQSFGGVRCEQTDGTEYAR